MGDGRHTSHIEFTRSQMHEKNEYFRATFRKLEVRKNFIININSFNRKNS